MSENSTGLTDEALAKLIADLHVWADAADEGDRIAYAYANGAPCPDIISQMGADIRKACALLSELTLLRQKLKDAERERDEARRDADTLRVNQKRSNAATFDHGKRMGAHDLDQEVSAEEVAKSLSKRARAALLSNEAASLKVVEELGRAGMRCLVIGGRQRNYRDNVLWASHATHVTGLEIAAYAIDGPPYPADELIRAAQSRLHRCALGREVAALLKEQSK